MEGLFAAVNAVLSFVTPVSDFFWDFPKMFGFWKAIPLLGQFSLAIIVLVGSGLYFTFRLGFIQIQCFSRGVRTLMDNHSIRTGISPLGALKTYPIAGYPNERIFGISCIGLLTHHSCRGSALLYSNFGKTLLWHVPDLSQSGS